jgi:hypothetical protein
MCEGISNEIRIQSIWKGKEARQRSKVVIFGYL